jgi:hypothetical protein
MFMEMLLLLLLPTTARDRDRQATRDYVAPPPLYGQAVGPLSIASVPTYDTQVALSLGDCPHIH